MRAQRSATIDGTPAWLRALLIALFIVLAVPAAALGADEPGPTAVLDQPAAAVQSPVDVGQFELPLLNLEPVAADPDPVAVLPVDVAPSVEIPAPVDAAPVVDITPVVVEPSPAVRPDPIPLAQPPAAAVPVAPIVRDPVVRPDVGPPSLPPVDLQPPTPPVVVLPSVLVPAIATPALAPELPELVPGGALGVPPPVMLILAGPPPSEASTVRLPGLDTVVADPTAPPTPGVAAALGIPNTSPALTIGPPQVPAFTPLFGASSALPGAGPQAIVDFVAGLLVPTSARGTTLAGARAPNAGRTANDDERATGSRIFDAQLVSVAGTAPAGSSLLAVLAGYALPGGGGAPASTLVLFIVVGLIIGLGYAACSQGTERIAIGRLLGAASGHRLAVCRPG